MKIDKPSEVASDLCADDMIRFTIAFKSFLDPKPAAVIYATACR